MKKIFLLIFMLVVGVGSYSLEIRDNKIVDSFGNTIPKKEYKRVVIIDPAVVETFYLLEGEDSIIAIGKSAISDIYPVEKTKKLSSIGNITKPSIEKILSFTPDLVILNQMASGTEESLKTLKVPYIINKGDSIDEILENIKIYGTITGREKKGEELYNESLQKLENLRRTVEKKPLLLKGALLYTTSPMMGFNKNSLPGEIFEILGVENIAGDLIGDKPIISQEYLLEKNPDFLAGAMSIKSVKDIVESNLVVRETIAGKKGNLFIVDSNKILRGSPRIFEEIEEIHSELLKLTPSL